MFSFLNTHAVKWGSEEVRCWGSQVYRQNAYFIPNPRAQVISEEVILSIRLSLLALALSLGCRSPNHLFE